MSGETTSQALEKLEEGPGALIERHRDSFEKVLPTHVKPEHWLRLSMGCLKRDANLRAAATKNPGSFLVALLDCARLGLEPGVDYYFLPFGGEVVGVTDYKGEIALMLRGGAVTAVKAEVVYADDEFHFTPDMQRPIHKPDWFADDRGEMIGVYAYAELRGGGTSKVVMMNRKQVMQIKAISKTSGRSDSVWNQWPDRAWIKTAVHQLKKWVSYSAEYRTEMMSANLAAERVAVSLGVPAPTEAPNIEQATDPDEMIVDAELVPDGDEAPTPEPTSDVSGPDELPDEPMTEPQNKALHRLLRNRGGVGETRFPILTEILGRPITTTKQISKAEASMLIDQLQADE